MTYEPQITRSSPTAFLFVVDESGSMSEKMTSGRSKAEFVADALNKIVMDLVIRCTRAEGVRDYFEIGVVGYGGSGVGNGFAGLLGTRVLNPIFAIEQNPVRVEDRKKKMDDGAGGVLETSVKFPVWFEPKASGGTPMRDALTRAAEELVAWCDAHPDCYELLKLLSATCAADSNWFRGARGEILHGAESPSIRGLFFCVCVHGKGAVTKGNYHLLPAYAS